MAEREQIVTAVFNAVDEVNILMEDEGRNLEKSVNTVLFGKGSSLDSLNLVTLIMIVEQNIEEEFGVPISLADERAMSQKNSPFKSIGSLVDYISALLEE